MKQSLLKVYIAFCTIWIFAGCTSHTVDTTHKVETTHTVEVKPMHITIDINLKVDKELDDFFGDIDKQDATMEKEK